MNKYQKQAILDLVKVAVCVLGAIGAVALIVKLGVDAATLISAGSFALMIYCIYQLYLVRVGQLESEDQRGK